VAAGVAGGLGEYFGVDPVLFRVLFAVTAFFGGAGILAYIVAWAAIPERDAPHAPIDRLVGGGRRSNIPMWLLTVAAVIVAWGLLFSWWSPWRLVGWTLLPLTLAGLVLAIALSRRPPATGEPSAPAAPADPGAAAVSGAVPAGAVPAGAVSAGAVPAGAVPAGQAAPTTVLPPEGPPAWVVASRERRRRSRPVRWATFAAIVAGLAVTAIVDATTGIAIPVYIWVFQLILLAGLIIGAALRRPFWWGALLLIPSAILSFVFAGCRVSLHDGSGYNAYTPHSAAELKDNYSNAFGRTTLDLSSLPRPDASRTVHVRLAAGQVRLIVPPSLPVNVHANVHLGDVRIDGRDDSSGMGLDTDPITTAASPALTFDVQINAGDLQIDRSP
jgi:phage shock protein PspC (stress-responsive transcriptional regulator)